MQKTHSKAYPCRSFRGRSYSSDKPPLRRSTAYKYLALRIDDTYIPSFPLYVRSHLYSAAIANPYNVHSSLLAVVCLSQTLMTIPTNVDHSSYAQIFESWTMWNVRDVPIEWCKWACSTHCTCGCNCNSPGTSSTSGCEKCKNATGNEGGNPPQPGLQRCFRTFVACRLIVIGINFEYWIQCYPTIISRMMIWLMEEIF